MAANKFRCGVVEGFYGRPWSATQRRQLFVWMQSWGLNTYLYAPKDDLKHRMLWRELYSDSEAAELKALIADGHNKGIQFIYAIAPGLDAEFSAPTGLGALKAKAQQLIDLGCTSFALLFDDIVLMPAQGPLALPQSVADGQIGIANDLLRYLAEKISTSRLLFCPTQYCGRMAGSVKESTYLRRLGETLEPAIDVLWTGPEIVSETISAESIQELSAVIGRKPIIWDNLHANDYDMRRLYLGPYSGRPLELREEVAGVLSNPNCEFEVNYVPLRTLARWAQADHDFQPQPAHRLALMEWWSDCWTLQSVSESVKAPADAPVRGVDKPWTRIPPFFDYYGLELVSDCLYLPFEFGPRAKDFLAEFEALLREPPTAWGARYEEFRSRCLALDRFYSQMTSLRDRSLLYCLYRHVWELREEAHLLLNYLGWLQSKPAFGETFASAEHRPKTYRGGLVAELQRLLPMDEAGGFSHRPSLIPKHDPSPYR